MTSRNLARTVVPLAALALLVSACGGTDKKDADDASASASATSSPSVALDAGVSLTKAGSNLHFGDSATVAFEPNETKSTGLKLTVVKVARGRITDLAAYQLDAAARTSTPYYATVSVTNVGHGDVGRSAIPLWGLSSDDTLIGSSGFTNTFARCPSQPLPTSFASGATTATCLMYLVPKGASLDGISYRPLMSSEPIVWKGAISSRSGKPTAVKPSKQASKKATPAKPTTSTKPGKPTSSATQ